MVYVVATVHRRQSMPHVTCVSYETSLPLQIMYKSDLDSETGD